MRTIKIFSQMFGKKFTAMILFVATDGILTGLFSLSIAFLNQTLVNFFTGYNSNRVTLSIITFFVFCFVSLLFTMIRKNYLISKSYQLNERIYKNLINSKTKQSDYSNFIQNFALVNDNLVNGLPENFISIIVVIIMGISTFYINPLFLLLSLVSASIFALTIPLSKKIEGIESKRVVENENSTTIFNNILNAKILFSFFPKTILYIGQFISSINNLYKLEKDKAKIISVTMVIGLISNLIREFGILAIGLMRFNMSLGEIFALFAVTSFLNTAISAFVEFFIGLKNAYPSLNQLNKLLNIRQEKHNKILPINLNEKIKLFSFKNLSFEYENKKILKFPNMKFKNNTIYHLDAPIGTGKTTLFKILSGISDPKSGQIFLNNIIADKEMLKKTVTFISQEPVIFTATILENITMFNPKYNIEKINLLLGQFNLTEMVNLLPNKLDTIIDKNSISLGQKRRLMICRALLHDEPILILDEIFASLDKKNVDDILNSLKLLNQKNDKIIIVSDHTNSINKIDNVKVKL